MRPALALLLLLLAACAPRPLPPEARLQGAEVLGLEAEGPALLLGLKVAFRNPNPFPLPLEAFGVAARLGGLTLPLSATLPPGESLQTFTLRLRPAEALDTARRLLSPEGVPFRLEGRVLGQSLTLYQTTLALPIAPLKVRTVGANLLVENPNPFPLEAEGELRFLGQRLAVRLALPPRGEGRLVVSGYRPGLGGERELRLRLTLPGFFSWEAAFPL
ncbi:hypothetical protein YIM1640_04660 [Thermus oshimai]|jgi:hypothetical protein|uniref:Late embryogenesis abundant protein n=1 Tax=Thermus oshimai JL-2 TaxID=751945 RepID=K7QVD0_THEOS|nr:LEA type 2 family protein [Thermus oshimai]AFV76446.1 hypothetical protein Theos_1414 [Thermus oshimai JL-2]